MPPETASTRPTPMTMRLLRMRGGPSGAARVELGCGPTARRAPRGRAAVETVRPCGDAVAPPMPPTRARRPTPTKAIELWRPGTSALERAVLARRLLGRGTRGRVRVGVAATGREGQVGERVAEGDVVGVDAVSEVVRGTDELALDHLERDVDDIVTETATVGEALRVSTDHAEPVGRGRHRGRHVEAELLARGDLALGHVEALDAREEHRHEVVARGLGSVDAVDGLDQLRQLGVGHVLERRCVTRGLEAVERVLELERDDDLVDQRVAQARDLDVLAVGRLLLRRRPGADDRVLLRVALLGEPPLRDLQRHRLDVEARQGVVAGLGEVTAVEQVEDAQVEEERVLGLTGEGLDALLRGRRRLRTQRGVVGHGRLADVGRRDPGLLDDRLGLAACVIRTSL